MNITLYTTPTCVYCQGLKEYFAKKNVKYKEIDVSQNQQGLQKMVEISGQMGVPVVEINGDVVVGFDKAKIDELLKI